MDCHHCGKHGHIAAACRAKKAGKPPFQRTYPPRKTGQAKDTNYVAAAQNEDLPPGVPAADKEELHLYSVNGAGTHSIQVSMMLNGLAHTLELDTGAAVTIMSQGESQQLFPGVPLTKSSTLLRIYSGETLSVLGVMNVEVQYKQQRESLKLTIVSGKGPSLLGRDWLQHFSHTEGSLDYLIEKYNTLFTEGLGTIKTFQARLQVDPEGPPKFLKPRTSPYAIRGNLGESYPQ